MTENYYDPKHPVRVKFVARCESELPLFHNFCIGIMHENFDLIYPDLRTAVFHFLSTWRKCDGEDFLKELSILRTDCDFMEAIKDKKKMFLYCIGSMAISHEDFIKIEEYTIEFLQNSKLKLV